MTWGRRNDDDKPRRCPYRYCLNGYVFEDGKKKKCKTCGGSGTV